MGKAKTKKLSAWNIALIIVLMIFLIITVYDIVDRIITQRQAEESKR